MALIKKTMTAKMANPSSTSMLLMAASTMGVAEVAWRPMKMKHSAIAVAVARAFDQRGRREGIIGTLKKIKKDWRDHTRLLRQIGGRFIVGTAA
jgi:hypothetical protein